jgi:hypothetical protein
MTLKTLIVISGTVIASAVTALPTLPSGAPSASERTWQVQNATDPTVARKGDRLRLLDEDCPGAMLSAACADIYGPAGPRLTRTVERRIGESTSVLIRLPLSHVASR